MYLTPFLLLLLGRAPPRAAERMYPFSLQRLAPLVEPVAGYAKLKSELRHGLVASLHQTHGFALELGSESLPFHPTPPGLSPCSGVCGRRATPT